MNEEIEILEEDLTRLLSIFKQRLLKASVRFTTIRGIKKPMDTILYLSPDDTKRIMKILRNQILIYEKKEGE